LSIGKYPKYIKKIIYGFLVYVVKYWPPHIKMWSMQTVAHESLVKDISLMGIMKVDLMIYKPGEIQPNDEHAIYANHDIDYPAEHSLDLPFIDSSIEDEMDFDNEFRGKILRPAIVEQNQHYTVVREGEGQVGKINPYSDPAI